MRMTIPIILLLITTKSNNSKYWCDSTYGDVVSEWHIQYRTYPDTTRHTTH